MQHLVGRAFLIFAYGYLLSYGLRVINAIIGPELTQQLALSHSDLGLISAAYLITFAALQLPLGIWLDRYGARRVEAILLLVAASGCALFASSHGFWGLWLGRALIGVGVSACLMASLKAFRQWFAPGSQSRLGSGMFVSGTLGALCATVPVNAALPLLGWRGIFWGMALLLVLAAAAIWFGLQALERVHQGQALAPSKDDGAGYRQIFQDRYFRRLCWIGAANQGSMMALQSLWLGPWMIEVLGLSKSQSANVLFGFNLTLLLAYLLLSWRAPYHVVIDGAPQAGRQQMRLSQAIGWGLGSALLVEAICLLLHAPWVWVLWLLFGLCHSATSLVQSNLGLTFPVHLAGRANTAYNLILFVGGFAVQAGLGLLIDLFKQHGWTVSEAMRLAFAIGWLWQVTAYLLFMRNPARVSHVD